MCEVPFDLSSHKPRIGQVLPAAGDRCLILNGMNNKKSMTSLTTMASETPLLASFCSAPLGRNCPQATAPTAAGSWRHHLGITRPPGRASVLPVRLLRSEETSQTPHALS